MRFGLRLFAVSVFVVALAVGGAASASARRDGPKGPSMKVVLLKAAADELGMDRRELRQARRAGRSLVQIAASRQLTVDQLKTVLLRAAAEWLSGRVLRGELTRERSRELLDAASPDVDTFMNQGSGTAERRPARRGDSVGEGMLSIAAHYLHLKHDELVRKLDSGRSLAGVAVAQKRTVKGLRTAIRTAVLAKLERRATIGTLGAEKKRKLLARLDRRIERLMARSGH